MQKFVLQWHITHLCNLRCKHCYQEEYDKHMPEEMFYSALDKFDEFIKKLKVSSQINLTGGEPLFHPQFFEFATEIKKRGHRLGILTNGTMITDEVAKKIKELKPVFVQISLDGCEKIHDFVRGEGSFKKALEGIDNLKKYNVRVLVSFTAQKSNYKDFAHLAKVCNKYKVDKLWWDRVVSEECELNLVTEEFKKCVKRNNRLQKVYDFFGKKGFISNGRALQFIGTENMGYHCSAGKSLAVFLADGSVMACRRLPFVIGNISEKSLEEILSESEIVKKLNFECVPEGCMGCKEYVRCRGGAKCVTYAQTGKLFVKDVNCFMK